MSEDLLYFAGLFITLVKNPEELQSLGIILMIVPQNHMNQYLLSC